MHNTTPDIAIITADISAPHVTPWPAEDLTDAVNDLPQPSTGQQAVVLLYPEPDPTKRAHPIHYWVNAGEMQAWVQTNAQWLLQENARGADIYFSTGTFEGTAESPLTQYGGRKKANCVGQRSLFLDIDAKDQADPTPDGCTTALAQFLQDTHLPVPTTVVSTGNGLHAYWTATEDIPLDMWQTLSDALVFAAKKHALRCDTQCTVDSARILRLPGLINHADPRKPHKPVDTLAALLHASRPGEGMFALADMQSMLDPFVKGMGLDRLMGGSKPQTAPSASASSLFPGIDLSGAMGPSTAPADNSAFEMVGTYPAASWAKLRDLSDNGHGCSVIQWARKTWAQDPGAVGYDTWHGILTVGKATTDSQQAYIDIAYGHDDYSAAGNEAKAKSFGGPRTCEVFAKNEQCASLCTACPNKGKIVSPIMLGTERGATNAVVQAQVQELVAPLAEAKPVADYQRTMHSYELDASGVCLPIKLVMPNVENPISGRPLKQHQLRLLRSIMPDVLNNAGIKIKGAMHVAEVLRAIEFDLNLAAAFIDCVMYIPKTKSFLVQSQGTQKETSDLSDLPTILEDTTGRTSFYSKGALKRYILSALKTRIEAAKDEDEATALKKALKKATEAPAPDLNIEVFKRLKVKRQVKKARAEVDMHSSVRHILIPTGEHTIESDEGDGDYAKTGTGASMAVIKDVFMGFAPVVKHKRIPHEKAVRVYNDWLDHTGFGEDLLRFIVAARFATSRKMSHVWVHCESDWGKGVFIGCLKELGIASFFESLDEFTETASGKNSGKDVDHMLTSWVSIIDEFEKVTPALRKMGETVNVTPKWGFETEIPLYAKLFFSAQNVEALSAGALLDKQYTNRFLKLTGSGIISQRALWNAIGAHTYVDALTVGIAIKLDELVAEYRALGRHGAIDYGNAEASRLHKKHNITTIIGGESAAKDALGVLAGEFADWVSAYTTNLDYGDSRTRAAVMRHKPTVINKEVMKGVETHRKGDIYIKADAFSKLYSMFLGDVGHNRSHIKAEANALPAVLALLRESGAYIGEVRDQQRRRTGTVEMVRLLGRNTYDVPVDLSEVADDDGDNTPPTGPGNGGGAPAPAPAPAAQPAAPAAPRPAVDPSVAAARAQAFGVRVAVESVAAMPEPTLVTPASATPAVAVGMEQVVTSHEQPVSEWQPPPVPALAPPAAPAPAVGGVAAAVPANGTLAVPHVATPPAPAPLPNEKRLKALGSFMAAQR